MKYDGFNQLSALILIKYMFL